MTVIDVDTGRVKMRLPTLLVIVIAVAGVATTAVAAFATKASTEDVDPRFRSIETSMLSLKESAREQARATERMQEQLDTLIEWSVRPKGNRGSRRD